jgi:hypothetical protein
MSLKLCTIYRAASGRAISRRHVIGLVKPDNGMVIVIERKKGSIVGVGFFKTIGKIDAVSA